MVCAERATSREVRQWVEAAAREGQQGLSSRLGPVENALQALTQAVDEGRAHAASVAGDYTPQELQVGAPCCLSVLLCVPWCAAKGVQPLFARGRGVAGRRAPPGLHVGIATCEWTQNPVNSEP